MKKEKKKTGQQVVNYSESSIQTPSPWHRFYQIQRLHESFSTRSKACIFEEKKVPYIGYLERGAVLYFSLEVKGYCACPSLIFK